VFLKADLRIELSLSGASNVRREKSGRGEQQGTKRTEKCDNFHWLGDFPLQGQIRLERAATPFSAATCGRLGELRSRLAD
jgi:hypothetical protein